MFTFADAEKKFANCRDKSKGAKLAASTLLLKSDDHFSVRYHATDIVKIYPDRWVIDNGGYFTNTTKERIKEYSPARIYADKGVWFLNEHAFLGPVSLSYGGSVTAFLGGSLTRKEAATRNAFFSREVTKFRNAFKAKWAAGEIERPGPGDCWFCYMFNTNAVDHLWAHLAQSYHVPSLLFNAMKERHEGGGWAGNGTSSEEEQKKLAGRDWGYSEARKDFFLPNRALISYFRKRRQKMIFEAPSAAEYKRVRKEG